MALCLRRADHILLSTVIDFVGDGVTAWGQFRKSQFSVLFIGHNYEIKDWIGASPAENILADKMNNQYYHHDIILHHQIVQKTACVNE